MKICCFTGHRAIAASKRLALVAQLDRTLSLLLAEGFTIFRCGGARGFDTLAALRVLHLKKSHPEITLSLILPCPDQANAWQEGERLIWQDILNKADEVRFITERYTPDCMHLRNRALVDGADTCVAYLTHNRGGTLYTCSYALKQGVRLINLADGLT
ncbi:MAG: DUF1273 family protein [Clostridia bacterium]|nr:DUF1273 family protein [Clostridia bacterium]